MAPLFNRIFTQVNFENTTEEVIDIYLRFKDGFADSWSKNANNTLTFSAVKARITKEPIDCFFQKQQKDEKNNKPRQKVIIPVSEELAVEFRTSLYTDAVDSFTTLYGFFVGKSREILFIQEPQKDTIKKKCKVHVLDSRERTGTKSQQFIELCQDIDAMQVPVLDINKDKDKEIWKKYVEALRRLVKGKEQTWKIKRIGRPYIETNGNNERSSYVDIIISGKDLREQFEKEIEGFFSSSEIEDFGVNENQAFIEFNSFRDLSLDEKNQLSSMAEEYFYELSEDKPVHSIAGEIAFKYADDSSKDEIFSEVEGLLEEEYQIDIDIDGDGKLETSDKNIPHIAKLVQDRYASILQVKKDTATKLKVTIPSSNDERIDTRKVKALLDANGLDRARLWLSNDGKQIYVDVSAFIKNDFFDELNLVHVKNVFRFGNNSRVKIPVDGTYIDESNKFYCVDNISSRDESKKILNKIQDYLEDLTIRQQPTRYVFELIDEENIDDLRSFKTAADELDKSKFSINTSILTIWAESADEYDDILGNIRNRAPEAIIEDKPYSPSYYLEFRTDGVEMRQEIINKIQNELRRSEIEIVSYDSISNYARTLFEYTFDTEDERDSFKDMLKIVCEQYKNYLSFSLENVFGTTTYTLVKNESLELEQEKKTNKDVKHATFVYLNPAEKDKLDKAVSSFGDDANFKGGIQIGMLVRKTQDKLKFKITDEFDEMLNGISSHRIDTAEMAKGWIKPIFPGELTNIGRMIRAMKKVTEPGDRIGYPANRNLPNFLFDPNTARLPLGDLEETKSKILANLNEPLLKNQPKQLEAVAKAIAAKDIALIQGPPGTGKTTVIAEIIWQTLLEDPEAKILITSQTNLAVDNALERLKGKKLVRPIRIGNIEKFEDEGRIYSDKRLMEWKLSRPKSKEETNNADNAIAKWIEDICNRSSDNPEYADVIKKWKKGLAEKPALIKRMFSDEYLQHVNVFAATCSECGSRNFGETFQNIFQKNKESQGDPEFDLVIMDEASKATPPELVLPLTLGKKVVIIGDHKQLPPMIEEKEFSESLESIGAQNLIADWTKQDYKISQFEKLFVNAPKEMVASLDTQFRMHKQIMDCISQFYKDQEELVNGLQCGIKETMDIPDFKNKGSRWHGLNLAPFIDEKTHAIWVNVDDEERCVGTSYENLGEIEAIKTVLHALEKSKGFEAYRNAFEKEEDKEIGVITYYMPQMMRIREALYPSFTKEEWSHFDLHKTENEFGIPFRINTVDRFQGMERNIIIVSTVRSDKQIDDKGKHVPNKKYPFALGFAREHPRVNVGFSRAKRLLIVVGNERHFSNKSEYAEAISKMHRVDISQIKNL